jgi:hypothetical protein
MPRRTEVNMNKPLIPKIISRRHLGVLAGLLTVMLVVGCATQSAKTQAFSSIDQIESDLRRGITTKADVLLLLGEPDGDGALGGFDALRGPDGAGKEPLDAWYYESIKISIMGGLKINQQILLVFFEGDTVDGFLWFDSEAKGELK